jgi:hypothetical protein
MLVIITVVVTNFAKITTITTAAYATVIIVVIAIGINLKAMLSFAAH